MKRLRISAISFLNTAPLMWDFEHGNRGGDFEIAYTVPAACAEALRAGTADIGIIPAISYQTIPDLLVIPEVAIAADGAVRSILLVSKIPTETIASVAVDTSSRTSVALLQILFSKFWRPDVRTSHASSLPAFVPVQPDLERMLETCDAALLIGDPALTVDRDRYHVLDLAEEWKRSTGKPFVFAFWAVRRQAIEHHPLRDDLAGIFQQSREVGLRNVEAIAREWAPRVGISEPEVVSYLTTNISYFLDSQKQAGLQLFFELSCELGLIKEARTPEFLSAIPVASIPGDSR